MALVDISLIKQIIENHYRDIHSIKDLARFTNRSPEVIRKEFLCAEHITLAAFIRIVKVENAKRLLSTTKMTCSRVAREIGCSRPDVASRLFRRLAGKTMTDFQDEVRKK